MGADAVNIGKTIHAHPALIDRIGMAAEVARGSCTDLPPARKSSAAALNCKSRPRTGNCSGLFALCAGLSCLRRCPDNPCPLGMKSRGGTRDLHQAGARPLLLRLDLRLDAVSV
jgi:hypothetical protein